MGFADTLTGIANRIEGCAAVVILGIDGIPIERHVHDLDNAIDIEVVATEFTTLVRRSMRTASVVMELPGPISTKLVLAMGILKPRASPSKSNGVICVVDAPDSNCARPSSRWKPSSRSSRSGLTPKLPRQRDDQHV